MLGGDKLCSVPGNSVSSDDRILGLREGSKHRKQGTLHSLRGHQRLPVEERLPKYFNCLGVRKDSRGKREQWDPGNELSESHRGWIGTCVTF